ncbi:MAG TPA: glycoside hydrolase family 31 protein [Thermoanaerobaculia bacterium]|nr:glycoside hydrolase family 31 protein [Thermoanaerobaculia bacterium]
MKPRALALLALLLFTLRPAAAQWASLGNMPAPKRQGDSLVFHNAQGTAAVSVITDDIVRVRFAPARSLGRDHSYAVVNPRPGEARASFSIKKDRSEIATRSLRVTIRHAPFRISFADPAGNSLDEDDPARGTAFSGSAVRVWKRLRDEEHVYGFGEKTGGLDKRGNKLGGVSYAMWNSDTFAYGMGTDPLYADIPFFLVLRPGGATHGIFLDNTFRASFDVGHETQGLLAFGAEAGELNYYFIQGPHPKQVIERYTSLTGRMPLPPLWALGYHQCRYSYFPESRVRFIAQNFRERHIPADAIWLDIHYMDGYKPFTWDRQRFPDPPRLLADLEAEGFKVVTIVDPHPKKERGYAPYDTGMAGSHFVKKPDGSVLEADVWPSQAEKDPGPSVFPDFSRPATRDWWGGLYAPLLDAGVDGIWNDMDEPALFTQPTGTMPLDARHDNEGKPTDHREIHNVYGLLMTRSTFEGLQRLRPDQRPFVLTRATYAGGQRYAAQWPGDNISTWEHLRGSIPMLLGMGLSGLPFTGVDIGGFVGAPTPELYTRWLQAGIFYPFMRTHTAINTPDQEPWSFGARNEEINRRAIELRYELLPTIYSVMHEASETGLPALRPLVLEYPEDSGVYDLDDEFLFGSDLLAAPVLIESATRQWIYLPKGDWYDFWTGRKQAGGSWTPVPVTLETIPIFVKAGAFVFRQPVVQSTGEMPGQPLRVTVYPADRSERWLYEDDGKTLAYQHGVYLKRRFVQTRSAGTATVEIGPPEGSWRPKDRDLILQIRWDGEPGSVSLERNGAPAPLPRRTLEELQKKAGGWAFDPEGWIVVKQPDPWEGARVTVSP